MHRTPGFAVTAALAVGLTLAGCTQGDTTGPDRSPPAGTTTPSAGATRSGSTSTSTPVPQTPAPSTASPTAGAAGTIPATCPDLITAGKWDRAFARSPLNDPAVVGDPMTPTASRYGEAVRADGKRLECVWRDPRADITNMVIRVDTVDPATATDVLRKLSGYDCADTDGGYRCQKTSQNAQYPVIDGDTFFTRGDIGIEIQQSNIPTEGLLDDVIAHVF
jgi:hypothetical protein